MSDIHGHENQLCSDCFNDQGLRLDAQRIEVMETTACLNCRSTTGSKLNKDLIETLAHRFFVWGTLRAVKYGAAPLVQFNHHQPTSIRTSSWFEKDIRLIEQTIGVGFFYYEPRLWMVGEVEPLKQLHEHTSRASVIDRILTEYPIKFCVKENFSIESARLPTIHKSLVNTIANH